MKVDWRKKRTVYLGIEYAMGLNGDESASADKALANFKSRNMTPEEFEHFYLMGVDLKNQSNDFD